MPKDKMNRKRMKPKEPLPQGGASAEDLKKIMDGITESPQSCVQIKENIQKEIEFLRNHPELSYAKMDIEGLERFLSISLFAEHMFKMNKNVNMKNLLEYIKNIKTHGPLDDKPPDEIVGTPYGRKEIKHKIEFKV